VKQKSLTIMYENNKTELAAETGRNRGNISTSTGVK
jgi:hypothetical protein